MNSPLGWPGGKKNLVKRLIPLLPEHAIYVEPFCGSAKLLFAKEPSGREVINDVNAELMNFFLVAKHRPSALAEKFSETTVHPELFKHLRFASSPEDEVERAFRFAYLNFWSFGKKGEHFHHLAHRAARARKRIDLVGDLLKHTSERLQNVVIECADYARIIDKYDSPETLFYCDPPYVNFKRLARYVAFSGEQLQALFDCLKGIRGRFLMSEEFCSQVLRRTQEAGFTSRRIRTTYQLSSFGNGQRKVELLIANFALPRVP
jgi:DNA adenine methylase